MLIARLPRWNPQVTLRGGAPAVLLAPMAVLITLVLMWWGATGIFRWPEYVVPTPIEVWNALINRGWGYLPDIGTTLEEVLAGFGVGLGSGLLLALAMSIWPRARQGIYPILIFSQVVPVFVISVVVTIVFVNDWLWAQVIVTALYSFLPVVITGVDGLSRVDRDLIRLMQAAGATRTQIFTKVRIYAALPSLFSGAKLAMIFAVGAAAFSEWIGGSSGLGVYMRDQNDSFQVPQVFAGAIVLAALGACLFGVVALAEYILVPWSPRSDQYSVRGGRS